VRSSSDASGSDRPATDSRGTALAEQLTRRLRRWRSTAVPIVQAAPVAAVVCLGMTIGQRRRRAIELIVGVGVGVGIGDALISAIGTGPWQIALVVALAMSVAVLLDGGAVITGQAAVSAILVATLYLPGDTSGISQLVDGLIGGATGLLVVGVFPRSSRPGSPSL
jgi:uncharacterized membrane protein YgaE (UPF0421/DUF939 family)